MNRVPDFTPFFEPKSVLIIGASRNEYTSNGVVLKNLLEARYKAKIFIFHPFTDSILGIPTIKTIEELAALQPAPELAIVLTRHNLLEILEALGKNKIRYVLLQADINYVSTDQEYKEIEGAIQALIKRYNLNVLGPSMIGIIDYMSGFTSSIIPTRAHFLHLQQKSNYSAGVSFLSQSGGLSGACGWWNIQQPVPFSKAFHIGGEIQFTYADMLEFLLHDPKTQVITLYLKSITPEMIEVMQRCGTCKPVLVKYVGKDPLPLEKFQQAGAIPVRNYIELFEFAKVFMWCPAPQNRDVAIIGPSSGAINLLIAEMRNYEIHLASLQPEIRDHILSQIGGSTCALGNPVDYWPPKEFVGTQVCKVYYDASRFLMEDTNVSALFLALEFFSEIEFDFSIFETIQQKYPDKPVIVVLIQAEKEGSERLIQISNELHIPVFVDEVERAVRALHALLEFNNAKAKDMKKLDNSIENI